MLFSACNQSKDIAYSIDLSEFVKANNTNNLLKTHNCFKISYIEGTENSLNNNERYVDKDVYYLEQGEIYREVIADNLLFIYEDGTYSGLLLADGGEYELVLENLLLFETTADEKCWKLLTTDGI